MLQFGDILHEGPACIERNARTYLPIFIMLFFVGKKIIRTYIFDKTAESAIGVPTSLNREQL